MLLVIGGELLILYLARYSSDERARRIGDTDDRRRCRSSYRPSNAAFEQ